MNLTYRGVSYQPQTKAIATKKTKIAAKFRGLVYQLSQSIESANNSPYPLKYRGISYQQSLSNSPIYPSERRPGTPIFPLVN